MSQNRLIWSLLCILCLLSSCTARIPGHAVPNNKDVRITPDYVDVTIPFNIAPLNFRVMEPCDKICVDIHAARGEHIVLRGHRKNILIPEKAWHKLLSENRGGELCFDIYTHREGVWSKFNTVRDAIAEDAVDPWIAYRLIESGYTAYGAVGLYQRHLESFDERLVYSNAVAREYGEEQCIGSHAMQAKGDRWLFQIRDANAGLLIMDDDGIEKLDLQTDTLGGVFSSAAFHPELPLVAFSLSHNLQVLHATLPEPTEVIDFASDLVLFDMNRQTLTRITGTTDAFETQPAWSPDGRRLYFCQAECPSWSDTLSGDAQVYAVYQEIRYSLMSMDFDMQNGTFSAADTVIEAASKGVSASLPSLSPDGKYMLFCLTRHGSFPALQHVSDIYLLDLDTKELNPLDQVNARYADSHPGWSSSGRWIVFSSCRDDGRYARLYLSYFDRNGQARKAFLLPQKRQMDNVSRLSSYQAPVFMTRPIRETARTIQKAAAGVPDKNILLQ